MFGRKQDNDAIPVNQRIAQLNYAGDVRDFGTNLAVRGARAASAQTIQRIVEHGRAAGVSRERLVADVEAMREQARRSH
jgi:hypothetical protein